MKYLHLCRTWLLYDEKRRRQLNQEWNNLTFSTLPYPPGGTTAVLDVRKGLPFGDGVFDAVYANHLIEHLLPVEASALADEFRRVLRPRGVVRVVVPDLERAARYYLAALERRLAEHSPAAQRRYEWGVINLIDQKVRHRTGGLMLDAMRVETDKELLRELFGDVATRLFPDIAPDAHRRRGAMARAIEMNPRELAYALLCRAKWQLARGDTRKLGENDRWGWDRLSLETLLEARGFVGYEVMEFDRSAIPGWERYDLDSSSLGEYPFEPSVYVESSAALKCCPALTASDRARRHDSRTTPMEGRTTRQR